MMSRFQILMGGLTRVTIVSVEHSFHGLMHEDAQHLSNTQLHHF